MFDDVRNYLWLIPALPLLASALIALFGYSALRERSHWPCILGAGVSCVLSVLALIGVAGGADGGAVYYTWFQSGTVNVGFSLQADGLTAVMLVMVTFIGTLIAIYSAGYMRGAPGYPRYFAFVSLFLFSMTLLVLANNFILLYAAWEGVGLCSYLLIGFWYQRPAAAAAARKAFLVTRLGDIGLFLGILLLWKSFGHSLDYNEVFMAAARNPDPALLVPACLLLFLGAAGKSAQFPLHVWLPDAMEGPSPVSALIHAATMVTAGVYLVARCMPLFGLAPDAQLIVAIIGAFTALLAALIALTQTDLKRVLAYSTVSQLGFMFLALGAGTAQYGLAGLAVTAAIFHLFTHAFFKALLFLGAGSVMHAMGDVIDMRRFGGLRKVLPVTHWTFLCGAAALAGVPLLSGFWSKDEILAVAWDAGGQGAPHTGVYRLLFFSALVTAGLTAFYSARAYFMTFWGEERIPEEAYHHHVGDAASVACESEDEATPAASPTPHFESPGIMTWPLRILAVGAVGVGIVVVLPMGHFLEAHWIRQRFPQSLLPAESAHGHNILLMFVSGLVALAGIGLAYLFYVKKPALPGVLAKSAVRLYEASRNKFYLDELYAAFIVKPLSGLAQLLRVLDQYIVDGLVDLCGQIPSFFSFLFLRPVQNGLVQFYAILMALGVGGFLLSVLLR
ncbi:MAG: NADH-quinone oxidoreductase subunit L [Gemmataceae bacterium]|nr:NADH-quinone oxidoreductase subunit L [Gemmataceae bacterium]